MTSYKVLWSIIARHTKHRWKFLEFFRHTRRANVMSVQDTFPITHILLNWHAVCVRSRGVRTACCTGRGVRICVLEIANSTGATLRYLARIFFRGVLAHTCHNAHQGVLRVPLAHRASVMTVKTPVWACEHTNCAYWRSWYASQKCVLDHSSRTRAELSRRPAKSRKIIIHYTLQKALIDVQINLYIFMHRDTHAHTNKHKRKLTHMRIHTQTHIHTHTCTHTHTQTHTQATTHVYYEAHYTCRPYRCTQYICLYTCCAAGFDDLG